MTELMRLGISALEALCFVACVMLPVAVLAAVFTVAAFVPVLGALRRLGQTGRRLH